VIAVSSSTKKLLVEKAGVREQKITIVPNGVPPDQKFNVRSVRKMQEGRLRLLTVGGLKPHKNIHFIPLIAQSLIRSGIPFDWHIVGGPLQNEYASKIIKQVKALRFENYVHWRGEVSNEDVADEYQNADFYIHLSRQEGFCITVLEALAAGVPVIGTPVGAISEMVRAGSGLVVEPTWRNLESGIKSAISNYESFRRGPDMGRQIQMLYSWDNVAEQTEKLYEQISRRVDK
jgi:glycosyltransferase involved in cell wall biosynthesis